MTRAIRHGELTMLKDAEIRRAALLGAGCGTGWLADIDADLLSRLDATPRLQLRLFKARADLDGDPACLPDDAGRLIALSPRLQRQAALSAGLAYHLSAAGPVVDRGEMVALGAIFGDGHLMVALGLAHLSPPASALLRFEDEAVRRLVEADGWAILRLWLADCGLSPRWLHAWENRQGEGSISLIRSAAIAIGAAVATVIWEHPMGAER